MPVCIVVGVLFGRFIMSQNLIYVLRYALTTSLVILYISVGINLGSNRMVFKYMKVLGWKIVFLPIAIFLRSILGGILSGILLGLPLRVSVMSSSGMSYYSITGAYMTQMYGIEVGTYGLIKIKE